MDFISAILARMQRDVWPHRTGSGWEDHDVEFGGNLWSGVRLQIAAEAHKGGHWLFHCRFKSHYTFPSRLAVFATAYGSIILSACLFHITRWSPLLLLILGIPLWWARRQARAHTRLAAKLVGDTADSLGFKPGP
jgi:hypothetical protein